MPQPVSHRHHQSPCSTHTKPHAVCTKPRCFTPRCFKDGVSLYRPVCTATSRLCLLNAETTGKPLQQVLTCLHSSQLLSYPHLSGNHITTPHLIYETISSLARKHQLHSFESSSMSSSILASDSPLPVSTVEQHLMQAGDSDFCHSWEAILKLPRILFLSL